MSASPTTQRLTRASLRRGLTPHSVLTRMAQDADRAARIRKVKDDNPQLTWAQIADKVGVTERSAIAWQQTGGIGHENAKRLAKLVGVDPDWLWSGNRPATPDLPALLNGNGAQLARIEAKLDQALKAQAEIQAALVKLTRQPARSSSSPPRTSSPPPRSCQAWRGGAALRVAAVVRSRARREGCGGEGGNRTPGSSS